MSSDNNEIVTKALEIYKLWQERKISYVKTANLSLIEDEHGNYFICSHCNNGHYDANFALPFYCPYCGSEFINRPKYGVETY